MKKIINSIFFLFVVVALTSCADFLDEDNPDKQQKNKYYETENDIEQAVNAVYGQMKTTNYYNHMFRYTEIRSDNTTMADGAKTATSGVYNEFDAYTISKTNSVVEGAWNTMYSCIYKANTVLDHIDGVSMTDENREKYIAETKFLRALSYFHLVRLYGPVPLVTHYIKTESEAREKGRTPVDEIYTQIVEDLKYVTESPLPNRYATSDKKFGHVNRIAGLALLGKVYLTMYAELPDNKDQNLENAITYLEEAYSLKSFNELKEIAYADIFGIPNEGCPEIIYQVTYKAMQGVSSEFAYLFQPMAQSGLTSLRSGDGFNLVEPNLYAEYESALDRRRTVSIGTSDGVRYCKKYVDMTSSEGLGGNNWIVLRYADVILMLAEAYNEKGNEPKAKEYLDMVRVRANMKPYDESSASYHTSYPTLKDAILHERRVELAFENHRWYDLLRFKKGEELVTFMTGKGYTFRDRDRLLPIPFREEKMNPSKMYQNPGY